MLLNKSSRKKVIDYALDDMRDIIYGWPFTRIIVFPERLFELEHDLVDGPEVNGLNGGHVLRGKSRMKEIKMVFLQVSEWR